MSLVNLHDGWLRQIPRQGVVVTAAALADVEAYPTEPAHGLRATLLTATGGDGVLRTGGSIPVMLLLDPEALGWPAEHWCDRPSRTFFTGIPELQRAPETPALDLLGILYDHELEDPAHPGEGKVALALASGEDLDADNAGHGSPTLQAERFAHHLNTPIVLLFGPREIRLIHAPADTPMGWLSFPIAQLLAEDGVLLGALHMLVGERRLLSLPEEKRLPALLAASRATRVRSLELHDFSVFKSAKLELCPGINVILGQNGSGKTHAMKALYTLLRVLAEEGDPETRRMRVAQKLAAVLRPDGDDLGRLVRWGSKDATIEVRPEIGRPALFSFDTERHAALRAEDAWHGPASVTYLPTRELLALYEGFAAAYQTRQIAFDETVYDACLALQTPLYRTPPGAVAEVLAKLRDIAGGPVVLQGNRFYVQKEIVREVDGKVQREDRLVEAQLLAEGIRKVAAVAQLVANGSIAPGGTLIWDEPEGNLNPVLAVQVADLLVELAAQGIQTIVASHDYLFIRRLSLLSEYKKRPDVPIRFFGLCPTADGVTIETGSVLADLAHNTILDEFTRQADYEQMLFYESPS